MKTYMIAAAALLLGTSALAWAPDTDGGAPLGADADAAAPYGKPLFAPVVYSGVKGDDGYYAGAAYSEDAFADPAYADLKPVPVAYQTWDDETAPPPPDATVPADETMMPPPAEATMPADQAMPMQTAAIDLAPRPATANYPACDPGPGDDNCIQLYEPGVRTALASWDAPTGGFTGAETATAMAANTSVNDATNDEMEIASADTDLGTVPAPGADEAITADTEMAANEPVYPSDPNSAYQGAGGPYETENAVEPVRQTGYPACSATVTDRCIQLYERGVTGEGN